MKPRKKQPVVTRQAILDAAGVEFSLRGYAGTGIGAIVERADLTKGALFHHFVDKQSLLLAWIAEVLAGRLRQVWEQPMVAVESLGELIDLLRTRCLLMEPGDEMSCLVAIAAETAIEESTILEALEERFASLKQSISDALEAGQQQGWIHPSIQGSIEAGIVISMFSGFSIWMKCEPGDRFRKESARALEAYLETLRPQ